MIYLGPNTCMKPRTPRNIKIGPHRYKVLLKKHEDIRLNSPSTVKAMSNIGQHFLTYGLTDPNRMEICINKDLKLSMRQETLLHEVIHGILTETEGGVKLSTSEEEHLVQCLGFNLLQVLKDNPKFVEYLLLKDV